MRIFFIVSILLAASCVVYCDETTDSAITDAPIVTTTTTTTTTPTTPTTKLSTEAPDS